MERSKYLMGLSEERSGVMTKSVNVFDQTSRQIRCIKKTNDYLGDGTLITEEELEEGKLYTSQKNAHVKGLKRLKAAKIYIDSRLKIY